MRSTPPEPAPETICRSPDSVALATFQPVADRADALLVGYDRAVEEHLVEVDLTADVPQRPDLDARLGADRAGSR